MQLNTKLDAELVALRMSRDNPTYNYVSRHVNGAWRVVAVPRVNVRPRRG